MTSKRLASAVATAVLAGAAAHAEPPAGQGGSTAAPSALEAQVGAAKTAMMKDPPTALQRSLEALSTAQADAKDPKQAEKIATAQWLQGEALQRMGRADEAAPVIAQALATVKARFPNSKLHGD